jgi:hypothetical protein
MTSGVVTRRPPLNSLTRPSPIEHRLDLRAAAVDDDGCRPAYRRKTMSCAKAALRVSSTIALPPYFTTTSAPRKRSSQGSASTRVAALACGDTNGGGVDRARGRHHQVMAAQVL